MPGRIVAELLEAVETAKEVGVVIVRVLTNRRGWIDVHVTHRIKNAIHQSIRAQSLNGSMAQWLAEPLSN